ncbi:beta-glucoside-specific PTS transporter subunit IIABC [Vagococcus vulneris]|uniref:PTS system sucrose-specific EIIBCA component n=1 Tax=Vagococcus vulneris TaxID=1977869 RepID=A0A430A0H3_9ENTE|nr:beta-glucoside-specific PTS transporter subunit IIABC [Vagococcus vulneris]RST99840.1 PTS beta-glucoside transporter subunit EIIBCA [Vagococcus vulneris]
MNNKQLAEQIINFMGGKQNISQSWHCITRLRFNVIDAKKIKLEEIKMLNGVLGAQFQGGQFQVIIGHEVTNVYAEIDTLLGEREETGETPASGNIIDRIFDVISGIFTPILAAITGSGLLKGLMAILVTFNLLSDQSSTYQVLNAIADSAFYFLPFLVGFSAANKFKTNPSLAVALAGILLYPTFINNAAAGEISSLKFIGLSIPMNNYASTVIPIILGVWLLSYVEKYTKKIIPKSLSIIFVPLISLLVTAPILLAFIAPLGVTIGSYLEIVFTTLFKVAGPFAGALMGGLMPLIVITGMHYAFFPSTFASFEKFGFDIMLLPMNLVANLAQAGATLGVFIKTKDEKMKQLAISSFIPALFGITEPAIYGVTMKLKKPFYASMIGGAVGGVIFGSFAVKTFSFTVPGILALPTYVNPTGGNNFLFALVGIALSFMLGLILTIILLKEKQVESIEERDPIMPDIDEKSPTINKKMPIHLVSPLTGHAKVLSECPDETFASEIVGKGIGIIPTVGNVTAPFSGVVTMTTPTNHAIGLISDDGIELLIHIGIDTVSLNGEGFERFATEGDVVKVGEKLLEFDMNKIKESGLSLYSPIIVTNTPNFLEVLPLSNDDESVEAQHSQIITVIN